MKSAKKKLKPQSKAIAIVHTMPHQDATLALIDRAARDKAVDVVKMRELLNMKLDYEKMLRQDDFHRALIAAQKEMEPIVRATDNTQLNSKYAKLEQIARKIKPIYQKHGFGLDYTSRVDETGQKWLGCWLLHERGHKDYHELPGYLESAGMKGNRNKTDNQGIGVMVSYMRRYLQIMMFNLDFVDEDDNDGNSISEKQPAQDKFTATVAVDEERDWLPEDGVIIQGKQKKLDYRTGETDPSPELQALNYVKKVIDARKHKASRAALINENLSLLRVFVKANQWAVIDELHALADKGE